MKLMLTSAALLLSAGLFAQAPTPRGEGGPGFDVVSVKVSEADNAATLILTQAGRFTVRDGNVRRLISIAYGVPDNQISPTPDWVRKQPFLITATFDNADVTTPERKDAMSTMSPQILAMVRKMLADRFNVVVHREQQDRPIYSLVVARTDGRLGPWMSPSSISCTEWLADSAKRRAAGQPQVFYDESAPSPVTPDHRRNMCMTRPTPIGISGGTQTMDDLAKALVGRVGRPVVNHTGLTGTFNYDLQFVAATPVATSPDAAATPDAATSIYTAIQEQLGLKLENDKAPVEMLIVDRVEPPQPD